MRKLNAVKTRSLTRRSLGGLVTLVAWAWLFGLSSDVSAGQGSAPTGAGLEGAFTVTRSVTGRIVTFDANARRLSLEDDKGRSFSFVLGKETKFRADRQTSFGNRKDLSFDDLAEGQRVRVTFRGADNTVTELRWSRPKS
jgi:hypothetical protein